MIRMRMLSWGLVVSIGLALAAHATVKIVGDPTPDYVTITNAVAYADAGDVIRVSTGTYVEVFDFFSRTNLTVDGRYDTGCVAKVGGATLLQATAKGPPVVWIEDSSVQLIDLNIMGARPGGSSVLLGGGLYIAEKSDVRMQGCRVYDNWAKGFGGGIYVTNSSLTLTNSLVYSNYAFNTTSGVYQPEGRGGGVAVNYGYLEVYGDAAGGTENSIKWNYADHMGGGIYLANGSIGILSNETSDVLYNTASNGGGIAVSGGSRVDVLRGADVCANSALHAGGGIYLEDSSTALVRNAATYIGYNATLLGANTASHASDGIGGGVAAEDSTLLLENTAAVAHNRATHWGGGIHLDNSVCVMDAGFVGYPYNFLHTNEANAGGGVFMVNGSRLLMTNDATIHNSLALSSGGGIYAYQSTLELDDAEVRFNTANVNSGGGIYVNLCTITARQSRIHGNVCMGHDGGGVRGWATRGLFSDVYVTNNACEEDGGGISWSGGGAYTLVLTNDSRVRVNRAGRNGGGVWMGAPVRFYGGSVTFNTASNHGAGLFVSNTLATVDGTYLEQDWADVDNDGQGDGGAVCVAYGGSAELRSSAGSTLINNNRAVSGGGIFAGPGTTVTIFKTDNTLRFAANTASDSGGGIHLYQASLTVTGAVVLRSNGSREKGGALYVESSRAVLSGGVIVGDADTNLANRAGFFGGGMSANFATVLLANVTFIHNVASNYSGGLDASSSVVGGTNVLFHGNQALLYDGGAAYLEYGNTTLRDSTVTSNTAARRGGGLVVYEADGRLTACCVADNSAPGGGGICVDGGNAFLSGTTVAVNRATGGAGGILLRASGKLYSTNLVLLGNAADSDGNADGSGGGLMLGGESEAYLYGTNGMSVISSNTGYYGGAAYLSNGYLYISGKAWVERNVATNGGGFYVAAGTAHVFNAYFLRNAAGVHGGGLFICTNSFLGMLNCLVAENTMDPGGWGGGIRNLRGEAELIGCTIVSNTTGGVECSAPGSSLRMDGCIVYGHPLVNVTAGFDVEYSDIEGGYPGTGNYDAEPLLNTANYHLTAWSPCRDMGWLVMGDRDVDHEARSGNFDTGFDEFVDGDSDNLADVVETDTGVWANDADMGTDPGEADSDGDTVTDGDEWLADTDPNNAGAFLRITNITVEAGTTKVQWIGGTRAQRRFYFSRSFSYTNSPSWQLQSTEPAPTAPSGTGLAFADTNCAIYRVRASRIGF